MMPAIISGLGDLNLINLLFIVLIIVIDFTDITITQGVYNGLGSINIWKS